MKTMDDLIKETAERSKGKPIPRGGSMQLPLWHEHLRGLPNAMARGALFTCANRRTPRMEFKRTKIATVSGFDLYYTGTELRQDDEDVFLQIVHFARMQPLGDVVEITGSQLLKALGWSDSKTCYTRLKDIIERLKEGTVKISNESGRAGYAGSLIRKFSWRGEEESQSNARVKWKIYLEREIISLFADDSYTLLDWEDRAQLGMLAKWLHSFYYTHREPLPYKTQTLLGLSGSKNADLRLFRRDLKLSLDELQDIGFLKEWIHNPETDTFRVTRSQQRALR